MKTKFCVKCNVEKARSEFSKHKKASDGLYYCCRECRKQHRNPGKKRPESKETARERQIRFHLNNPTYAREYSRKWAAENPEKIKEKRRRYISTGRNAHDCQVRRARASGLKCDLSDADWEDALSFFENQCAYCGEIGHALQKEHIIPVSKGGAYTRKNIIPACGNCNASKRDMDFLYWLKSFRNISPLALYRVNAWRL